MMPPVALIAHAVTMPSGVPPMPIIMSTPVPGRAAAMAPATSPSRMNFTRAPAWRISLTRPSWRGRSSTHTVTWETGLSRALATRFTFCFTGRRMSTKSAASGPTTSLSM